MWSCQTLEIHSLKHTAPAWSFIVQEPVRRCDECCTGWSGCQSALSRSRPVWDEVELEGAGGTGIASQQCGKAPTSDRQDACLRHEHQGLTSWWLPLAPAVIQGHWSFQQRRGSNLLWEMSSQQPCSQARGLNSSPEVNQTRAGSDGDLQVLRSCPGTLNLKAGDGRILLERASSVTGVVAEHLSRNTDF